MHVTDTWNTVLFLLSSIEDVTPRPDGPLDMLPSAYLVLQETTFRVNTPSATLFCLFISLQLLSLEGPVCIQTGMQAEYCATLIFQALIVSQPELLRSIVCTPR